MVKTPTNMRLSDEALKLKELLAQKLGIDETAVVEMALRKLAEAEGVRSCELYFQQFIEGIIGEQQQQEQQGFDISISEEDTSLILYVKLPSDYCANSLRKYSSFFSGYKIAQHDATKHSCERRSNTQNNKEAHEVK